MSKAICHNAMPTASIAQLHARHLALYEGPRTLDAGIGSWPQGRSLRRDPARAA